MAAESSEERPPSIISSSSPTEADTLDDNEKHGTPSSSEADFVKLRSPDELDIGDDVERAELLPQQDEEKSPSSPDNSTRTAIIWMVVNTLATIGIVGPIYLPTPSHRSHLIVF